MKKTFSIESEKHSPENQLNAIRYEIKKYIARERRKKLPESFRLWVFDCKFGSAPEDAKEIHEAEIKESITKHISAGNKSFYIEIIAKPSYKPVKF